MRLALQRRPSSYGALVVVDEAAVLHGTFILANLAETAFDTELNVLINAEDVARLHPPVFDVEHGLGIVMHSMQSDNEDRIVVVEDHVSLRILGVVRQRDVMMAYRRAVLNRAAKREIAPAGL